MPSEKQIEQIVSTKAIQQIEELTKQFNLMYENMQKVDKAASSMAKSVGEIKKPSNSKELSELQRKNDLLEKQFKAQNDAKKGMTELDAVQKERQRLIKSINTQKARNSQANSKEAKELRKLKEEQKKANAARRDAAKAAKQQESAYSRLTAKTRELKNRSKELAAQLNELESEGKQSSSVYKKLASQYGKATKEAQQYDKQLKKIDSTVGDNFRNVGNYSSALGGLKDKIKGLIAGFGGLYAASKAFNVLKDFSTQNANIAKTTGLTVEQAKGLSKSLLTLNTSTSLHDLQDLAAAAGRLNITGQNNIKKFVKAANISFSALGTSVGANAEDVATNLGKIAANFGNVKKYGFANAIERTGSAISKLANATKASEGDIFDFTTRLSGLGSVVGLSETDVEALGAVFGDSGIKMQVAGTTLNKVIPLMATHLKTFAKFAGISEEKFNNLVNTNAIDALKLVAKGVKKSASSTTEFSEALKKLGINGGRAVSVFGVLSEKTQELTKYQNMSADTYSKNTYLAEQYQKSQDTLAAAIGRLVNKFKEWFISATQAGGVIDKLKDSIDFLANHLGTILKVIKNIIEAFISYKVVVLAAKLANSGFGKSLISLASNLGKMKFSLKGAGRGLKNLGKSLNNAKVKAAATVFALIKLTGALKDTYNGTQKLKEQNSAVQAGTEQGNKALKELIATYQNDYQKTLEDIHLAQLRGDITEAQAFDKKKAALEKYNDSLSRTGFLQAKKAGEARNKLQIFQASFSNGSDWDKFWEKTGRGSFNFLNGISMGAMQALGFTGDSVAFEKLKAAIEKYNKLKTVFDGIYKITQENTKSLDEMDATLVGKSKSNNKTTSTGHVNRVTKEHIDLMTSKGIGDVSEKEKSMTDIIAKMNKEMEKRNATLLEYTKELKSLENVRLQGKLNKVNHQINDFGEISTKKQQENYKKLLDNRKELETKMAENTRDSDLAGLEYNSIAYKKVVATYKNKLAEIDYEYSKSLKNLSKNTNKTLKELQSTVYDYLTKLSNSLVKHLQDNVDKTKQALQDQQTAVDTQRERAKNGLTNTLAFEKKQKAKLAAQEIEQEKRLKRAQMIQSLWQSYTGYVKEDPKTALQKTLKDFAVLEAIQATLSKDFKKGGYTGDIDIDEVAGVTHGKEFVVDAKTTKELNLKGATMSDFRMMLQSGQFMQSAMLNNLIPNRIEIIKGKEYDFERLEKEIRQLKEYQMSVPQQRVDVQQLTNDIFEIKETIENGKSKVVNRYRRRV